MTKVIEKLKDLAGIAKPGGIDDVVVRAVKLAVAAAAGLLLKEGISGADVDLLKAAGEAAYITGAGVLLNALLLWGARAKPEDV